MQAKVAEMANIVDITGPIYEGMWTYGLPYEPFRMEEVPPVPWVAYPTYTHNVAMNVQTGTYLETGAHMFPSMRTIDQLRADELFLYAHIVYVGEKAPGAAIARGELGELKVIAPGDAILVCTGWGRNWESPRFLEDSPYFLAEAMDYLLSFKPALFGADLPLSLIHI